MNTLNSFYYYVFTHPEISVAATFLIILGTVLFFRYYGLFRKLKIEISSLDKGVQEVLSNLRAIDLETIDQLTNVFRKHKIAEKPWAEFEETVIQEITEDNKVLVYSTKNFSSFFKIDNLLEQNLHLLSLQKIPTIITSLGLLFTFVFIIYGLSGLSMKSDGTIEGISTLISGLSGKFITSVLGITGAVAFNIFESIWSKSILHDYNSIIDSLSRRFNLKTSEDYLKSIDSSMAALNKSMQHFSTDLASVIKNGLTEGLTMGMAPSTNRLIEAIEKLEQQKTENIADTMNVVLQEFRKTLNQGTEQEFTALAANINKLSGALDSSSEKSKATTEALEALVTSLSGNITKQTEAADSTVTKVSEGFGELLSKIKDNTDSQKQVMETLVTDLIQKTGNATSTIVTDVNKLAEKNSEVVKTFDKLTETLATNIENFNSAAIATKNLIEKSNDLAENLQRSTTTVSDVQNKINQSISDLTQETAAIQDVQRQNTNSVQQFNQVFKEVETGLEAVLGKIAQNIQNYNDLTSKGLTGYLNEYDNALAKATGKLSGTVNDLNDVLENLDDILSSHKNGKDVEQ